MADTAVPLAIAGVSHHTANVMTLEAFRFASEEEFLAAARDRFAGVILLQTCNRVEVIVEGPGSPRGVPSWPRAEGLLHP